MHKRIRIESFDHPELAPYRTMKRTNDHHQQGIFVAEGEKVVRRLLATEFPVLSVVLPPKWAEDFERLLDQRREVVPVYVAELDVLEKLTGFSMYQGVMAVARIPERLGLNEVLKSTRYPRLLAAVDGLSSAENLGVVVRNCAAFDVDALIVGETSSSPYLRRAVRSSMGTIFQLPAVEVSNLRAAILELRGAGFRCVAAHPHTHERMIWETDFRGDCCLVFGSEGMGISKEVLNVCDEAVAIPMPQNVDSLNVSSAAAVFLYEAYRQRIGFSAGSVAPQ